jgi:O-antigen ligase
MRGVVLAIAGFIAPPLGLFAPLGLSPLLFVTAAAALAVSARERQWPSPPPLLLLGLTIFVLWSGLTAAWAIDPGHSLLRAVRLVTELGSGLVLLDAARRLSPSARQTVLTSLVAGLVLGAVLVGIDRVTEGALVRPFSNRYNGPAAQDRGATVVVMLMWTALLWCGRRYGPLAALILLALVAAIVLLLPSDSAKLALGAGGVIFLLGLSLGRLFAREGAWILPVILLVMPFAPLSLPPPQGIVTMHDIKPSGLHRLVIWRFAAERIKEKPIFGWGLDASRDMPGMHDKVDLPVGNGATVQVEMMPLHPHNNPIQIWLELGIPGAVIAVGLIVLLLRRLSAPDIEPGVRSVALATLVAALVIACLSYGMWQGWWLGALWFAATFVSVLLPPPGPAPSPAR